MKFIHTLLLWSLPLVLFSQVQTGVVSSGDLHDRNFIEKHFEGGFEGYVQFFEDNLKFPEESYKNQIEGLLLFNYTVHPAENKVDIEFLTLLDKRIEKNVAEVIQLSLPKWESSKKGAYRIYQSLIFSLLPYYAQTLEGDLPELPGDLPLKFIQPFIFIKSKRLPKNADQSILDGNDATEKEKKVYLYSQEMYKQMLDINKPELAYEFLNVLIRYNPLRTDYLLDRIKLEKQLGVNRFQAYDAMLLSDFVDGYQSGKEYAQLLEDSNIARLEKQMKREALKEAVDSLYMGKYREYLRRFESGFHSQDLKTVEAVGAVIYETKVTKEGEILVTFLTRLDDAAQNVIIAAIRNSMNNWLPKKEAYRFVQVVFLNNSNLYQDQFLGKVEGFPEFPLNAPFLPEITLLTSNDVKNMSGSEPVDFYKKYVDLQTEYEQLKLSKENQDRSYELLNRLIEFNPFNQDHIMERMALELALGKEVYQSYDQTWLRVLAEMKAQK